MSKKSWREQNMIIRVCHCGNGRIRANVTGYGFVEVITPDPFDLPAVQAARRQARDLMIQKARSAGCVKRVPERGTW